MFFEHGGGPLSSIADVLIDAITDKEIIQFDSASGKYINRTLAEAGIGATVHVHDTADITTGTLADVLVAASNVTQHVAAIDHDSTLNFVAGEHFLQSAISITEAQVSDLQSYLLDTTDTFTGVLGVIGSINNAPGSDIDTDLITVDVTGTPTFSWDESEDRFLFNTGINTTGEVRLRSGSVNNSSTVVFSTGVGSGRDTFRGSPEPSIYITESVSGSYPFDDRGNLVIEGRTDAGTRSIAFVTGTSSTPLVSMVVASNNRVGIGLEIPTGKVHIDQGSTIGAVPVLHLDQADLSEEFIKFSSTIGTGNPIEAVAAKTMTPTHFLRVELTGGLVRYINAGTIS